MWAKLTKCGMAMSQKPERAIEVSQRNHGRPHYGQKKTKNEAEANLLQLENNTDQNQSLEEGYRQKFWQNFSYSGGQRTRKCRHVEQIKLQQKTGL